MTRKHYWHVFLQRDVGTFKPRTIRRAIDRVAREWTEQDRRVNPEAWANPETYPTATLEPKEPTP